MWDPMSNVNKLKSQNIHLFRARTMIKIHLKSPKTVMSILFPANLLTSDDVPNTHRFL